ncbi:MAG: threonine-phosphate decarboxylase [Thermomicrobiales bacterium]|nr:threonine-phosphate decarboxylase [Thermomicrobiales bacterium]
MAHGPDRIFGHGGNLRVASDHFGHPPDGWLDLSTGINPRPYPIPAIPAEAFTRLPGAYWPGKDAYKFSPWVVAAPGSELLIRLLPHALPEATRVAVLGPTYSSHASAWRNAGRTVVEISELRDLPGDATVLALANPNNPDGRQHDPRALVGVARTLAERGGALVVDEAFVDVAPEVSYGPYIREAPAIILRSFGKFYGLPGLRLGMAVTGTANRAVRDRLADLLGAWPVSGPALFVAKKALQDTGWAEETRRYLANAATRLRATLASGGLTVVGGTDLFALVQHKEARQVHAALAWQGVWTRVFTERPDWIRFGLPSEETFPRFEEAIAKLARDGLPPGPKGLHLVR